MGRGTGRNSGSPFESGNWPPTTADLYKQGPAAKISDFYLYDEQAPLECPVCRWTGSWATALASTTGSFSMSRVRAATRCC
jgi:hypothetical protein